MTLDADLAIGAIASLYRLSDELPATRRPEAIEYVRRVEAEITRLRQALDNDLLSQAGRQLEAARLREIREEGKKERDGELVD